MNATTRMMQHALEQGSAEWLAHRTGCNNASDAPAMLGASPYCTRSQLLQRLSTGIEQEVDAATQRRFDDGHRTEALLRPLAEEIIGEELYAIVGTRAWPGIARPLGASYDGLTIARDVGFECKRLNKELRAALPAGDAAQNNQRNLSLLYRTQVEQQFMVCPTLERILFGAAEFDADGNLVDARWVWCTPDLELRAEIVAGWAQFEQDLTDYAPAAAEQPKPTGRTPETLPALRIEVTGMVTASNLDAFKEHALAVFGGINTALQSDQDFADAERTVKWCEDVEERLKAAKQHALSQTESIDALFRAIDEIGAEARRVRLDLDKKVKAEKERRRGEIVADGVASLREHCAALDMRLGRPLMPTIGADFGGVIKGKKSLASMEDAVATELARAKIAASEVADRIQANLQHLREHAGEHRSLFPDTAQLVLKPLDDLKAVVTARIAEHREAEEARRRREEEAAARAATPAPTAAPAPAPVAAAPVVVPMQRHTTPPAAAMPATLTVGAICERLGFTVTAEFVKRMGIDAAATEKGRPKFTEAQFATLCDSLVAHIRTVAVQVQQQAA